MEIEKHKAIGWMKRKIFFEQTNFSITQPRTKKGEIKKIENYLFVKIELDEKTDTGFYLIKNDKKKLYRTINPRDRISLFKSFEEHTASIPTGFRRDQRKKNIPVKRMRSATMDLKATKVKKGFLAIHDTVEQFDAILGTLQANIFVSNAHNGDKMETCLNNLIAIRNQLGEEFDDLEEAIEESHVQQVALETKKINEAYKLIRSHNNSRRESQDSSSYEIDHPYILGQDYESLTDKELKHIKKREAEEQKRREEEKKRLEEEAEEERMRLEEEEYEMNNPPETLQYKGSMENYETENQNPSIHNRLSSDNDLKASPEERNINQTVAYGRVDYSNMIQKASTVKTPTSNMMPKDLNVTSQIAKLSMNIFYSDSYAFEPRTSLNKVFRTEKESYEFKNFIKGTKVKYPLYYHEPISELQKQCEIFMHSELLDKAAMETDETIRMCYILAFIATQHSLICTRLFHPFDSLRGETYEYIDNQRKYQYFSELVSIKPNIYGFNCQNPNWSYYGDSRKKFSFNKVNGIVQYDFLNKEYFDLNNSKCNYSFNKPSILIHKTNKPKIRITIEGKVIVQSSANSNIRGEIEFFSDKTRPKGDIEGTVLLNNFPQYLIKGNYLQSITYNKINAKANPLWKIEQEDYLVNKPQKNTMPAYSYNLNHFDEKLADYLPPTDTRRRPDIREYEEGSNDVASDILKKFRVIQKKLSADKNASKSYKPSYFVDKKNKHSNDSIYLFNEKYWQDRQDQNWAAVNPNIFKFN